jgi:restriction system protein
MPVPDYQSLMRPLLVATAKFLGETSVRELSPVIATSLKLSDADLAELLPSGRQSLFANRLNWAKSYLSHAGAIESTRRGHFCITERGKSLIASASDRIDVKTLMQFSEFETWLNGSRQSISKSTQENPTYAADVNPEEAIDQSFAELQATNCVDLLDRVLEASPTFFERMIVDLLLAMGYGGGSLERGLLTARSGDGGVDGIINEDALGLDAVYIQAKRYAPGNTVDRPALQAFVGMMTGEGAEKGVFVTTSTFTSGAKAYVEKVQQRIVLIDGKAFAELAVRHNVGVRNRQTYHLKRVDEDYFSEEI